MRVLVTGGTGVIGTAAIPALLQAGHNVRLLTRHADADVQSFPPGVEACQMDLTQRPGLAEAVAGCACVLHIAGIVQEDPPELTFEAMNIAATQNLLDAARESGTPYFIHVSSLGAERGTSDYHVSKRRAEECVRSYGGPWLILRPAGVYGPGDETVSLLLRMVRALPAVPKIGRGDQPFQPLWYADLGAAIAQAVMRADLAGQKLELAGPEITTTDDLLDRLGKLTGRNPARLPLPVWLTEVGVQALAGLTGRAPVAPATITMLLEQNIVADPARNALIETLRVTPTPLDAGLRELADLLPEQLPGDGVGAIREAVYFADIVDSGHAPASLLAMVCDRLNDVMPIDFAAEPGAPARAREGATLTARIPGRGNVQVRLEERAPERATFLTLEGHPLAGMMQLRTSSIPGGVRFGVHIHSQAANRLDWLALHTIGSSMQSQNWHDVVARVVELSGGRAPEGVQQHAHRLDQAETDELRAFVEQLAATRQRALRSESVKAPDEAGVPTHGRQG